MSIPTVAAPTEPARADSVPGVGVVVCTYTDARRPLLEASLASVRAQRRPADAVVVVVDGNDRLADELTAAHPDLLVVRNDGRGLSDARNCGVRALTTDVVAFLDDDARADVDWLLRAEGLMADPTIAGVSPRIEPAWETARPDWFPRSFDWVVGCTYDGFGARGAVRNLIGAAMVVRRDAYRAVGGCRREVGRVGATPLSGDDTDLCIRIGREFPDSRFVLDDGVAVHHTVPAARASLRYFTTRCYHEGLNKSVISRSLGPQDALSAETRHVALTLPRSMLRDVRTPSRVAAAVLGVAAAGVGFVVGAGFGASARRARRLGTTTDAAAPGTGAMP